MFRLFSRSKAKQVKRRRSLRKAAKSMSREQALKARPVAAPLVRRRDLPEGGAMITVMARPGRVSRFVLRLPEQIEHDIELDGLGVRVLDLCDGNKSVGYIIKRIVKDQNLDPHEGEHAVTAFLNSLMKRGLVTMVVLKDG
jgi:hypothetical protein